MFGLALSQLFQQVAQLIGGEHLRRMRAQGVQPVLGVLVQLTGGTNQHKVALVLPADHGAFAQTPHVIEDFQHGDCLQLEEGQTRIVTHVDGNHTALTQGVLEFAVEVAVRQVGGRVHAGEDIEDNRIEAGHAQQFGSRGGSPEYNAQG